MYCIFLHFSVESETKMKIIIAIAIVFAQILGSYAGNLTDLEKHEVVPDVIKVLPQEILQVTYDNNLKVDTGNVLTPKKVKNQPKIKWTTDPDSYYTLLMIDPDVPSRSGPSLREWNHWIVGNIPGTNITSGEVIAEYIGAGPPRDTGLHRYIFIVYKQPGVLTFDELRLTNKSGENRGKFNVRRFAEKYEMGDPIAANFFQAKWDSYVRELYKQLGY